MSGPFFAFEADFVATLRCVPMIVRFNLDLCGIKLSLRAWNRFDHATRADLAAMPARTQAEIATYRDYVCDALLAIGEQPSPVAVDDYPLWKVTSDIPAPIRARADALAIMLGGRVCWQGLTSLQRFALLKLTRGGHENANFVPALREFGLLA
ncbi:nitrate reductase associated protein [Cupriavidus sp. 2TAF22]|uniref:nitrate reductase associated protein n=1 Tax=unclassified Cupriavidus TaxID=2640874 RepID=UPI003F8ED2DC